MKISNLIPLHNQINVLEHMYGLKYALLFPYFRRLVRVQHFSARGLRNAVIIVFSLFRIFRYSSV